MAPFWSITSKDISRVLGHGEKDVLSHAARLGLSYSRNSPSKPVQFSVLDIAVPRAAWIQALTEHGHEGRNEMRRQFRPLHDWLRHYDRPWLEAHLPPRIPKSSNDVDWQARDVELAREVRCVAECLRGAAELPVKVTTHKIFYQMENAWARTALRKGQLPLTAAALTEVADSRAGRGSRRASWVETPSSTTVDEVAVAKGD